MYDTIHVWFEDWVDYYLSVGKKLSYNTPHGQRQGCSRLVAKEGEKVAQSWWSNMGNGIG